MRAGPECNERQAGPTITAAESDKANDTWKEGVFPQWKRTKDEKTNTDCFPANKAQMAGCVTAGGCISTSLVSGK